VGKPGLDGHSNGAEQIADARTAICRYGNRLTRVFGLPRPKLFPRALEGEHRRLVGLFPFFLDPHIPFGRGFDETNARTPDWRHIPVIVGWNYSEEDAKRWRRGLPGVYSQKDL